jgi:hypothetical protein
VLDTAANERPAPMGELLAGGDSYPLQGRSLALLTEINGG